MKKCIKYLIVILLFLIVNIDVNAYTKEDIIILTENINICSDQTDSLLQGFKASYTRLLNEKDISEQNINKIYNNINKVIQILNKNELCSVDQKDSLSDDVKKTLIQLFEETNNIILSSPSIVQNNTQGDSNIDNNINSNENSNVNSNNKNDNKNDSNSSKVVVDSANNQIKIYENGILTNVIELEEKMNNVGINKTLVSLIEFLFFCLICLILLRIVIKRNFVITSFIYVIIFFLSILYLGRAEISILMDTFSLMKVDIVDNEKTIIANNEKILSYPSYGSKYATIYINNNSGNIYFGDSNSILKKGIGQANSSYLPGEGKKTILSGHNTGVFKELFNVKVGQNFVIETVYGKFTYKIEKIQIVKDNNSKILNSTYDLIMYTCYPNLSLYGDKRLVVFANLVDEKWIGDTNEE